MSVSATSIDARMLPTVGILVENGEMTPILDGFSICVCMVRSDYATSSRNEKCKDRLKEDVDYFFALM